MFGIDVTTLLFILLSASSVGGIAYAILFQAIENEAKADRRLETVKRAETDRTVVKANRDRVAEAAKRRKSVQDSLNDLELKQRARDKNLKRPPLKIQLRQAGLQISLRQFYIYSAVCGLICAFAVLISGVPFIIVPGAFLAGMFGLPRWFVTFKRARRVKAFLAEFPNSLDILVRSVKSGLPLHDGVRLIASEAPEPVKSEFRRIVEAQQLGMSLPEATLRMQDTMPCAEAGFFGIVIQIQSQAGGNLSEALGNLSKVLRDRKKMQAKVQALSMEARASAAIIGALPFIVAFLVYLSSPNYIMPLFTHPTGHFILIVSGIWMSMGIFVMKKMMNFDI
jgi:tight adherence protein B